MMTVVETVKNDNVYCGFIQFAVVNSSELNVWYGPETETGRGIGTGTTFGGARRGGDEK